MVPVSEGSLQPIMGVEVVKDIIKSICDDKSARAMSSVSSKCREWFLSRVMNNVVFLGKAVDLYRKLDDFSHNKEHPKSVAVRNKVK